MDNIDFEPNADFQYVESQMWTSTRSLDSSCSKDRMASGQSCDTTASNAGQSIQEHHLTSQMMSKRTTPSDTSKNDAIMLYAIGNTFCC